MRKFLWQSLLLQPDPLRTAGAAHSSPHGWLTKTIEMNLISCDFKLCNLSARLKWIMNTLCRCYIASDPFSSLTSTCLRNTGTFLGLFTLRIADTYANICKSNCVALISSYWTPEKAVSLPKYEAIALKSQDFISHCTWALNEFSSITIPQLIFLKKAVFLNRDFERVYIYLVLLLKLFGGWARPSYIVCFSHFTLLSGFLKVGTWQSPTFWQTFHLFSLTGRCVHSTHLVYSLFFRHTHTHTHSHTPINCFSSRGGVSIPWCPVMEPPGGLWLARIAEHPSEMVASVLLPSLCGGLCCWDSFLSCFCISSSCEEKCLWRWCDIQRK